MFRLPPIERVDPEVPVSSAASGVPVFELETPSTSKAHLDVEDGVVKHDTKKGCLQWHAMSSNCRCMIIASCAATILAIAGGVTAACILASESGSLSSLSNSSNSSNSATTGATSGTGTPGRYNPQVPITAAKLVGNGCTSAAAESSPENKLTGLVEACKIITTTPDITNRMLAFNAFCTDMDTTTSEHKGGFAIATMQVDACIGNKIWKPFTASSTTIETVDAITTHLASKDRKTLVSDGVLTEAQFSVYSMCDLMNALGFTPAEWRDPDSTSIPFGGEWGAIVGGVYCTMAGAAFEANDPTSLPIFISAVLNGLCPIIYTVTDFACCDTATCKFTNEDGEILAQAKVLTDAVFPSRRDSYLETHREVQQMATILDNLSRMQKMAKIAKDYFPEYVKNIEKPTPERPYVPSYQSVLRFFSDEGGLGVTAAVYGLKGLAKLGFLSSEHSALVAEL